MGIRNRLLLLGAGIGLSFVIANSLQNKRAISLQGRTVLITGSSRGLGLALAHEFALQGARLVICARHSEALEVARRQLEEAGAEVLAVPCDISDQEQVEHLVGEAIARFGHVDVLVNNAGIITVGPVQTMTLQDFEEALNIMFWGSVYPTLALLPYMRERGSGHIVNITSIGGKVAVPHLLPYSSAKFATVGFSEGLCAELAQEGIRVTTIVPGLMRTGSHINAFVKGKRNAEYTWFGLSGTLPFTSMSATEAARQIVWAAARGRREHILTLQAQLLARLHGLFPGLTVTVLERVNRLLPKASEAEKERRSGQESRSRISSLLTGFGEVAARKYNQYTHQR